jgi:pimeloyl-ACP methyl ester carboxylesterase
MSPLDDPRLGARYFFPQRAPLADPWVVPVDGAVLHGWRSPPGGEVGRSTLLHFHGNGEVVADWLELAGPIEAAGYALALAEYRGYGGSTGTPAVVALLDDALASFDALGVPPERVVVYGRSIGSLYAVHVAAHRPVAGLVVESGIADLLERLLLRIEPSELGLSMDGLRAEVARHLDQRAKLARFGGEVLILHARHDDLVRPWHAEQLAETARARPSGDARTRLVLYPHGDHNSIHAYNGPAILTELAALRGRLGW